MVSFVFHLKTMLTPQQQAHWAATWVHLNVIVQADAPLDIFAVSKIMQFTH